MYSKYGPSPAPRGTDKAATEGSNAGASKAKPPETGPTVPIAYVRAPDKFRLEHQSGKSAGDKTYCTSRGRPPVAIVVDSGNVTHARTLRCRVVAGAYAL